MTDEEQVAAGPSLDAVRCFRLLTFVALRLRHLLDARLRSDGLTVQQGMLLSIVRANARPSLGEVARAMGTSHQNAKQVALAAERKGFVRIASDDSDGRIKRIVVTPAGQRGWVDRNEADFAAIGGWFAALDADEQRQLVRLLTKLVRGGDISPGL